MDRKEDKPSACEEWDGCGEITARTYEHLFLEEGEDSCEEVVETDRNGEITDIRYYRRPKIITIKCPECKSKWLPHIFCPACGVCEFCHTSHVMHGKCPKWECKWFENEYVFVERQEAVVDERTQDDSR